MILMDWQALYVALPQNDGRSFGYNLLHHIRRNSTERAGTYHDFGSRDQSWVHLKEKLGLEISAETGILRKLLLKCVRVSFDTLNQSGIRRFVNR